VLLSTGSWFGGWSFYFDEGRPITHHAASQQPSDQFEIASDRAAPPGRSKIRFAFEYDGGGVGKGGDLQILIGNELIAQGRIEQQVLISAGLGETMDIGRDTGVTVVTEGAGTQKFNGKIHTDIQFGNTVCRGCDIGLKSTGTRSHEIMTLTNDIPNI